MTAEVEVYGLRELREALMHKIPQHMQGKVLQKALAGGGKVVVNAAKSLVPVKTGRLRRAIYQVRDKRNSNGIYEQRVVTVRRGKKFQKSNRDAYYWRFVEFGRKAFSVGNRRQVLGNDEKGYFGSKVKAETAKPFLRPGFDNTKSQQVEAIKASLAREIPIVARKAGWSMPRATG
jgi:HK97 gp10 family phage protein